MLFRTSDGHQGRMNGLHICHKGLITRGTFFLFFLLIYDKEITYFTVNLLWILESTADPPKLRSHERNSTVVNRLKSPDFLCKLKSYQIHMDLAGIYVGVCNLSI